MFSIDGMHIITIHQFVNVCSTGHRQVHSSVLEIYLKVDTLIILTQIRLCSDLIAKCI